MFHKNIKNIITPFIIVVIAFFIYELMENNLEGYTNDVEKIIEQKKKERALKYKTNTKPPIHTSATINLTNAPAKSIINRNKLLNLSTNINNLANNFKKTNDDTTILLNKVKSKSLLLSKMKKLHDKHYVK
tara:strand:- start:2802 stop:3194 length:393 start_codon:yes stop_codon:yes gene_type:complete